MDTGLAPTPQTKPKLAPPPASSNGAPDSTPLTRALAPALDRLKADEDRAGAQVPPATPELPSLPQTKSTTPTEVWGSAAMAFAALGSLFTRQPATAALNAAAGVMKAFRQNDIATAQAEYERWKINTDHALKLYDFQNKAYANALKSISTDVQGALAEFRVIATSFHDTKMEQLAEEGKVIDIEKLGLERSRLAFQMSEGATRLAPIKDQLAAFGAIHDARTEFNAAVKTGDKAKIAAAKSKVDDAVQNAKDLTTALGKGGSSATAGDLTPEGEAFAATIYRQTGQMPSLGLGGAGTRVRIINDAAKQAQDLGITTPEIVAGQADIKALKTGLGRVTTLATVSAGQERAALKAMSLSQKLMDKGSGTSAGPVVNRWLQAGKKATGDPDVAAFHTAVDTFTNEYAKIVTGSTSATGSTDASRREAADMLSKFGSPEQIKAQMDVMRQDMNFKVTGWAAQRQEILNQITTVNSGNSGEVQHKVNDIITIKGKKYRVTGGDPSDPDVEPVK